MTGDPEPSLISTSYVERNNLSMRMSMRRSTRLTNAFSKKVENHAAAVALYTMWQNLRTPTQEPSESVPAHAGNGGRNCGPHLDLRGDFGAAGLSE